MKIRYPLFFIFVDSIRIIGRLLLCAGAKRGAGAQYKKHNMFPTRTHRAVERLSLVTRFRTKNGSSSSSRISSSDFRLFRKYWRSSFFPHHQTRQSKNPRQKRRGSHNPKARAGGERRAGRRRARGTCLSDREGGPWCGEGWG